LLIICSIIFLFIFGNGKGGLREFKFIGQYPSKK